MKSKVLFSLALELVLSVSGRSQTTDLVPAPYDIYEDQLNGDFNAFIPWWVHVDPEHDMIRFTDGTNDGAPTVAYLGEGLSINHTTHTLEVGVAGPQGEKGDTGDVGSAGPTGAMGSTGATGSSGTTGSQGIQGIQGATGSTGSAGADGALSIRRIRAQTDASGNYTWTYSSAFGSGVVPVVSVVVEGGTTVPLNVQIVGSPGNTSVTFKVLSLPSTSVLGITVIGVPTGVQAWLNITAIAP